MKKRTNTRKPGGFTVIEMIVAILLIAIIAVTVFSRFGNPSSFDSSIARDNLIALALLAQQTSLGRENVTFEIDPAGGDWAFSVVVSGAVIRSVTVPGNAISLETGSTVSGTCALGLDEAVTQDFQVTYNGNGNATGFTNGASAPVPVSNGVRICVNDSVEYSACISPAGFPFQGNCDD